MNDYFLLVLFNYAFLFVCNLMLTPKMASRNDRRKKRIEKARASYVVS